MSARSRKSPPPSSGPPVPLLLLAAFLLGAGTMWLISRSTTKDHGTPAIQTFGSIAQTPGVAALAGPPDTSQLGPAEAARTLGNWNYDRQNWTHAIEHYQEAIALGADNPDVRTDLGNCFRFLGQPQQALEQYELAQKQNPQHENSLFNQISLQADLLKNSARALAVGQEFLARFPQSPQAATARQLLARIGPQGTPGR